MRLTDVFPNRPAIIGMVHLLPLPGSPRWSGSWCAVLSRAIEDARFLVEGGVDGVMVENFGDVPFFPERVPPETVAAMTRAARAVIEAVGVPVGVNVLRNDAAAALGIAAAVEARFIRINVHTGAMWSDQGLLQGQAHETLRLRHALGADVLILADVLVKHAVPPAPVRIEAVARDLIERGLVDALIVSGEATGGATDLDDLRRVKQVSGEVPVWVGSGVTAENAPALFADADGAIVGTAVKRESQVLAPVDPLRVRSLIAAARAAGLSPV
jgi:membrane complex biogenesis BtpA family protein